MTFFSRQDRLFRESATCRLAGMSFFSTKSRNRCQVAGTYGGALGRSWTLKVFFATDRAECTAEGP